MQWFKIKTNLLSFKLLEQSGKYLFITDSGKSTNSEDEIQEMVHNIR